MPDAAAYGDVGSDTLGNIVRQRGLVAPNLLRLGLGNLKPMAGLPAAAEPQGAYGRCTLASPGKDTTTGHWEMVGIHLTKPFPVFPNGFPPEVMDEFEARIGRSALGNKAASGTEIIRELGAQHMETGSPIVYTSADSVFQIAAHEDVIPLWELYRMCEIAREILRGKFEVGRVIARPFEGEPGSFRRTANRHDYAVPPPPGMLLDRLEEAGVEVESIGKIFDVFLGRGIGEHTATKSNADGMARTLAAAKDSDAGLIFVNLVDFDQQYGHRNDVEGYGRAIEEFDAWLPQLEAALRPDDLVILTADHGCDPTTPSTDHSREYTPLICFGPRVRAGVDLGLRATLSDIGRTVAENFGTAIEKGSSFLKNIDMTAMHRKPLMAGNWKMYKTPAETRSFFDVFEPLVAGVTACDIAICPPFVNLAAAVESTEGSNIAIGAQNLSPGKEGAFTGEISGHMLSAVGCKYVIVAHSERRQYFGESEEDVVRKVRAALEYCLTPIVCVGERLEERESGNTETVLGAQFDGGLAPLTPEEFAQIVIAYEPVWAIGTGRTATPEIAQATHNFLRGKIAAAFGPEAAATTRILYGGSVKPDNVAKLMAEEDIDGALVGGASLDPKSFAAVVKF